MYYLSRILHTLPLSKCKTALILFLIVHLIIFKVHSDSSNSHVVVSLFANIVRQSCWYWIFLIYQVFTHLFSDPVIWCALLLFSKLPVNCKSVSMMYPLQWCIIVFLYVIVLTLYHVNYPSKYPFRYCCFLLSVPPILSLGKIVCHLCVDAVFHLMHPNTLLYNIFRVVLSIYSSTSFAM